MNIMLVMNNKSNQFNVAMLAEEEGILFTGLLDSVGDDVDSVVLNILATVGDVSVSSCNEGDSFTMSVIVPTRSSSLIVSTTSTTSSNMVSSSCTSIEGRLSLEDITGEFSQ